MSSLHFCQLRDRISEYAESIISIAANIKFLKRENQSWFKLKRNRLGIVESLSLIKEKGFYVVCLE